MGDGFLRAMFGPPSLNALVFSAVLMYGDLFAAATDGDEQALAFIAEHPVPGPDIETDKAMLRMAGMDVTDDDIRSLRDWYWPDRERWPLGAD
ncbi:hypothetical protein [Nocardia sp. NPDC057455]|uniref:hypothetical protein n=1 Tax=Nocardia sp. NPDC057455 TaxID=3346138 RepID=UPI003672F990